MTTSHLRGYDLALVSMKSGGRSASQSLKASFGVCDRVSGRQNMPESLARLDKYLDENGADQIL